MIKIHRYMQYRMGGLVLLIGLLFSVGGYWLLSKVAENDAAKALSRITSESGYAVDRLLQPATILLNLLANVPDLKTGKEQDWMLRLPAQASILIDNKMLTSIYVGGPSGQFLLLRALRDDLDRQRFHVSPQSRWLVQTQRVNSEEGEDQYWTSLDAQFHVLSRQPVASGRQYDPRTRPWYQASLDRDVLLRTSVYNFFTTGKRGVTLAKYMGEGWVIGMDIEVESLEPELARLAKEQAARIALLENTGAVISADTLDNGKDIFFTKLVAAPWNSEGDAFSWMIDPEGRSWWVGTAKIKLEQFDEIELHVAVPRDRLLAKAQTVRNALLMATLFLTAITLLLARRSANQISAVLQTLAERANSLTNFDFSRIELTNTKITEIAQLETGLEQARVTSSNFMKLLDKVSRETDLENLLPLVLEETSKVVQGEHAWLYIYDSDTWSLRVHRGGESDRDWLADWLALDEVARRDKQPTVKSNNGLFALFVPLFGRRGHLLGLLILERLTPFSDHQRNLVGALSGFAALTLESRELIAQQKQLFESFIKLLAEAVDAKSAHTGGHCHRVPILTEWLVELAASSDAACVADFTLDNEMREAVHIAAWLHDCGKVVTPEYVVDKATKLETLYDRIHEIRMRFEVCKRDAELAHWYLAYPQGLPASAKEQLAHEFQALDDDFAFVAECNLGSENMSEEAINRIKQIAARTWVRTLDDRLGLSHDEISRRSGRDADPLPTREYLLRDQPEHQIARPPGQAFGADNPWGFKMRVPELLYDRGEVKNLSIQRGTLTEEERYKINEHIVMTIKMLEALPFPRHLANVPEIAGGHHERTDSGGYPRSIPAGSLSIPARMMAIADVFEALTATDRPYKTGKSVEASLEIMRKMAHGGHLDVELFELFSQSEIPERYVEQFLKR
ncbi:HD-GYP domain, c-di-GMP phosphodiesterase class II (or its inactivated variant) [Aeromonas sp. RU39B]|uniref:HD domain-containing phosphohydrolase n=1 Tax=Aeromonas sp. RU39B TaxID=1907416 RepID=UPI000954A7BE|nr:HD domain-containing phosphohydrolase [Aeromonas sp. RU39B]SIQ70253.1 HD-GYP domain, c-di-GMP phosphodiesterase class II (or its inactivated variant) [Aeromonas sp. RU39B]